MYPETYPEVSTRSTRPALPFPRPVLSKRSLCDPVNLVGSVSRLTVGEATALCKRVCEILKPHPPKSQLRICFFTRTLTVTPEITGVFPSISLNTSASASSPIFSLYFFLASSPRAILNSSYVMVRQDFFLKQMICYREAQPTLK